MSAQVYLARLMSEGRVNRGPHAASLRTQGLTRLQRRIRRAMDARKH